MKKVYKHIFFDLDHTLWDFERNAEETKQELFTELQLGAKGIPSYESFRSKYIGINLALWALYREDKIGKDDLNFKRFHLTLLEFGIDDKELGAAMASKYLEGITTKTYLFPYTREILEYLYPKYPLYIITNGFEEVQFGKLKNSGLDKYFTSVITSEEAGVKKPDSAIFLYALSKVNADVEDSLMIGDDLEVDIGGARDIGMDQLFVNHERKTHETPATFEVTSLKDIENIL
ncbi:MAG: noncanonical pyrimidine nucleotidase, YjjG family [Bacteroidetes bacterium]|nr:noncanonical pyrimidine nucleotidase, YjjG family [Bacteroidota bacterium]